MALPPAAPPPVPVVLPLVGDALPLLDAVSVLVARWPEDVDARLVVPAAALTTRDRTLLAGLGDEVQVVELPGGEPTFGALVAAVDADGPLVVLDHAALPDAAALRALAAGRSAGGGVVVDPALLATSPVLTAARDLRSLAALLTALAPLPSDDDVGTARVREPALDAGAPVRRRLVSVVVPVRDQLARTQACLAALRRSTRAPYELIVVDDGSTDETRAWLAAQRDLVVVAAGGRGFAAACNEGVRASRGDTVVLLTPDTVVPRFWADGLLRALDADPRVAAAGPRGAGLPGAQRVPTADYADLTGFRSAADAWRRQQAGRSEEVARLSGACLAVRREALLDVGGLDEGYGTGGLADDDLSLRLRRAGWSLRVAEDVLVHCEATSAYLAASSDPDASAQAYRHHRAKWGRTLGDDVLLTAALIVKDEQTALPRCLAALRGVVDEVVVCDTGSTDRTVEVAEAFGARVVHAPWQGDFAAARNAALAHCHGTWVLSVDADEQLGVTAGHDLRRLLLGLDEDAVAVTVRSRSQEEGAATFEHEAGRLFRRGTMTWVGAVHETLVDARTGRPPRYVTSDGLWLDHDGYVGRVYEERDKTTRNLLLAEKDHEQALASDDTARTWKTAYELARALSKHEGDEARVEHLMRLALAQMPAGLEHLRCDAHVRLSTALARQERLAEAEATARTALTVSPGNPAAVLVLAEVLAVLGRHADALAVIETDHVRSSDAAVRDLAKSDVDLPLLRARLQHELGQDDAAAQVLLALAETQLAALDWPLLHAVLSGRPDGSSVLASVAARDPESALAALDGLAAPDRDALHAALGALGVDAAACSPAALQADRLDAVLRGHAPDALAQAALALEDTDLVAALDVWSRVPVSDAARVAIARCLLQLARTDEAVAAVEGVDVEALDVQDVLVVAAVAASAGDRDTAQLVLDQAVHLAPAELSDTVAALAQTLGLALPDRVDQGPQRR